MPKPDITPLNLDTVARGAAIEYFEKAITKVMDNIADPDTSATAAREITIKFKFKPEADRRAWKLSTSCNCKLAAVEEHVSRGYIGKDSEGHSYAVDQDPRQDILFEPPAKSDPVISFPAAQ